MTTHDDESSSRTDGLSVAEEQYQKGNALVQQLEVEAAYEVLLVAAEAGHPQARLDVAQMLLHGVGTGVDLQRGVDILFAAERDGDVIASYLLALAAVGNRAVPMDARINARTLAGVRAGYRSALLAAAIHFGRKANPDDQHLALELFKQAAAGGDVFAAQLLAERLRGSAPGSQDAADAASLDAKLLDRGIAPLPSCTVDVSMRSAGPPRTLALEDVLQPPQPRLLSDKPRVLQIDGLLSADECRLLMAMARPGLKSSSTVREDGSPLSTNIRTSSDVSFDPLKENLALRLVQARIATAAGVSLLQAEPLIVLSYQPGQQYHPHRDYLPATAIERNHPDAGDRAATICVYLNDVDAGGGTAFPVAGLTVAPKAGSAIAFRNLFADGRPDMDSLHAGLPVERGEKWLATLWLRERRYRDF